MRLYSYRALYRAVQPFFAEGCGTTQFAAIARRLPIVEVPGRKHPMYDLDAVTELLSSSVKHPEEPEPSSLHRRRKLGRSA